MASKRRKCKGRAKKGHKRIKSLSFFLVTVAIQRLVIVGVGLVVAYYVGRSTTTDLALSAASLTLDAASYCL